MTDRVNTKHEFEKLLANTYVTLMLTQNVHWHVMGPNFYGIHLMTDAQYNELQKAIDEIAEHMRAMGLDAPSGMQVYQDLATVAVEPETMVSVDTMLEHLINAHTEVRANLETLAKIAADEGDIASEDLAIERMRAHDKHRWMLKASLTQ